MASRGEIKLLTLLPLGRLQPHCRDPFLDPHGLPPRSCQGWNKDIS